MLNRSNAGELIPHHSSKHKYASTILTVLEYLLGSNEMSLKKKKKQPSTLPSTLDRFGNLQGTEAACHVVLMAGSTRGAAWGVGTADMHTRSGPFWSVLV